MREFVMQRIAACLLLLISCMPIAAEECPGVPQKLTEAISRHIKNIRADEYCEGRSVKSKANLVVVIYTAEGACDNDLSQEPGSCSNNWVRYMLGEYNGKIIGPVAVGGNGGFTDRKIEISGTAIRIKGATVGEHDPMCCPSVPAYKYYKVTENGFLEVLP